MKRIVKFVIVLAALALVSSKVAYAQGIRFQGAVKASYPLIDWEYYNAGTISLGARLNEGNYLGIGSGSLWINKEKREHGMPVGHYSAFFTPLYLDYIHYFNASGARRNSFFLGAEAGGALCTNGVMRQKLYYHGDIKWGYDFGLGKDFGAFIGMDILAGYAYGIAVNAGFRF